MTAVQYWRSSRVEQNIVFFFFFYNCIHNRVELNFGFFPWQAKKINASRFFPVLSWAGQFQIFSFCFSFFLAIAPTLLTMHSCCCSMYVANVVCMQSVVSMISSYH